MKVRKGIPVTGTEIVKAIRSHRGKIQVRALFGDQVAYIYAEKKDLIEHFAKLAEVETGVAFQVNDTDAFIDSAI